MRQVIGDRHRIGWSAEPSPRATLLENAAMNTPLRLWAFRQAGEGLICWDAQPVQGSGVSLQRPLNAPRSRVCASAARTVCLRRHLGEGRIDHQTSRAQSDIAGLCGTVT